MTAHEQTLAELTAKICEAVPEIKYKMCSCENQRLCEHTLMKSPITLEHFVLTLQKHFKDRGWTQTDDKELMKLSLFTYDASILQTLGKWRMGKPLHEQSPETISFLYSLLHEQP
jgi:hypothetical protein